MSIQTTTQLRPTSGGVFAFLSNFRIGPKIIAGYIILILMLAGVAGMGYWGLTRITEVAQLALERQADIAELWAMQTYMVDQYVNQANLIINDDPALIESFRASVGAMDQKKENIQEAVDTPEEKQWMADLNRIDAQFDDLFNTQVVPAWEAGNDKELKKLDGQSDELVAQMQDRAQKLIASFQTEVDQARSQAEETERQTMLLMLGTSILAALAGLIFGITLSRAIAAPVQAVTVTAARLAQGDVNQELSIVGRDEIGQMAEAFRQMINYQQHMAGAAVRLAQGDVTANVAPQSDRDVLGQAFSRMIVYQQQMAEVADQLAEGDLTVDVTPQSDRDALGNAFSRMILNLRGLITQVADTANTVGVASSQLATAAEQSGQASQQVAATIQQIAQGTTQQTQAVTEAANNVEQMARASEGIARGAQEQAQGVAKTSDLTVDMTKIVVQVGQTARSVNDANDKVTQAARAGVIAVGQTGQGMEAIRSRTLVAADKVKEMGNRSKEIGRIVETIDDIADKTDMLALNAAVEAARAGEYGRGFAVVADQVRKLSEDSKGATRDIGDLIERVQDSIREAITAMDSTIAEVDNGARLTGDTVHSLEQILQAAENAASLAEQITTAVTQLKQKSEGVVAAIETVGAVVEENTAVAEEMASSSQEVMQAMESVAGVAEENSASAEEVSASAEEMSAQVEEVVASSQELSLLAGQLREAVTRFRIEETIPVQSGRSSRRWARPDRSGEGRSHSLAVAGLSYQGNGQK